MSHDPPRTRDADRSREAILDAAEALFAAQGPAAVSLAAIAARAGVSKGLPLYFFGSKDALGRAVLERLYGRARAMLGGVLADPRAGGADVGALLDLGVDAYLDFLAANPAFVRLMARAALDGPDPAVTAMDAQALGGAIAALGAPPLAGALRPADPAQVLLSIMGLCAFPFIQADHLLRSLGQDPADPAFLAARKAHVKDLLRHGLLRG